ncbi:MAG: hypothetical protein SF052_25215 [Bacteroidia bacterium]|nr:hypothetical protein [Bacteroidia bacterium]
MTDPETTTNETTTTTTTTQTPQTDLLGEKQPKTELLPKDGHTGREMSENTYYGGVLIATREANSLSLNSVGPLWILEITDTPDRAFKGKIIRTFENPGPDVTAGNPGDQTRKVWFKIQKMLRPDMVRIEVATGLRTTPPEA